MIHHLAVAERFVLDRLCLDDDAPFAREVGRPSSAQIEPSSQPVRCSPHVGDTDDPRFIPGVSSSEVEALLTKAVRCLRLTAPSLDEKAAAELKELAVECEAKAAEISSIDEH